MVSHQESTLFHTAFRNSGGAFVKYFYTDISEFRYSFWAQKEMLVGTPYWRQGGVVAAKLFFSNVNEPEDRRQRHVQFTKYVEAHAH